MWVVDDWLLSCGINFSCLGHANIKKQSINLLDILLFPKKVVQLLASKRSPYKS